MKLERDIPVNLVTPKDPVEGTLIENRLLTDPSSPHFTRHWVVDVSGTPLENNIQIGQAFGVVPEWDHYVEDNKVSISSDDHKIRLYSNASPSRGEHGEGKAYSTTVKRVIDEHEETGKTFLGVDSNYMCDLEEGAKVKLTGPTGRHFLLPDEDDLENHHYVFLATGTGIAPFRGMVMELLDAGITNDIWLILGVPYSTDILYGDFFHQKAEEHDNFHFQEAISREQKTEDGQKMYVQERLLAHRDVYQPLLQNPDTLVYICGLKGMETGIYRSFLLMGAEELVQVPGSVEEIDVESLSPRDDYFNRVSPNKERTKVEVY